MQGPEHISAFFLLLNARVTVVVQYTSKGAPRVGMRVLRIVPIVVLRSWVWTGLNNANLELRRTGWLAGLQW
jgi:hypothetical protein